LVGFGLENVENGTGDHDYLICDVRRVKEDVGRFERIMPLLIYFGTTMLFGWPYEMHYI
jgi:hypothetical protein